LRHRLSAALLLTATNCWNRVDQESWRHASVEPAFPSWLLAPKASSFFPARPLPSTHASASRFASDRGGARNVLFRKQREKRSGPQSLIRRSGRWRPGKHGGAQVPHGSPVALRHRLSAALL